METVNNMASAAAKAVWGESKQSGEEPISGQTGDPSKGEPYDAGNIEDPQAKAAKLETNGHHHQSTTSNGTTDPSSSSPSSAAHFSKETGTAAESADAPANPSADLKARSAPKDTSKSQADTRDPANPQTHPKAAPTDVNDADDGPNEAQKLDGPGPKPLEEVARQHGGDAGVSEESSVGKTKGGAGDVGGKEVVEEEEEEESGPNAKSKGEGTGEQYVKSSGLKADGGDFDATKPGAGREADRIMEEKGIHSANGDDGDEAGHGEKKEKTSIGQKIKNKLHRH
ncbi:uncharacterized protein F4807DRAFT_363258 [Annulohypoxylon truncatum]|uniref:uncharacterized protein n=1 Tax=Annulohypoxylon truncatum TaxID=327061 RepID=UPI002007EBCB|nr:uncharacterized protein F4807DRAFT_363258 [Annulohypoxylon truncatum]KAI1212220.1 hypothetical protein F4807DRAFT_363258 [Annulohypoxylon truncatum]